MREEKLVQPKGAPAHLLDALGQLRVHPRFALGAASDRGLAAALRLAASSTALRNDLLKEKVQKG